MLGRLFSRGGAATTTEPVNKFSPAYFSSLHATLNQQLTSKGPLQADLVVSALKDLGEVMVWAGKNEQQREGGSSDATRARMSEMFGELAIMKTVVALHKAAYAVAPEIQQQVLQTLSIVLLNLGSAGGGSLFFLLSNGHINELMAAPFDDSDEEALGYYISLLKTLSVSFNESTVNFFFTRVVPRRGEPPPPPDCLDAPAADFPMYTRAVTYTDHEESMVRAAVRTVTLNVYRLADPAMHAFLLAPPHGGYPHAVARRLRTLLRSANETALELHASLGGKRYTCGASNLHGCVSLSRRQGGDGGHGPSDDAQRRAAGRLAADLQHACADIEDELYYFQDVFALHGEGASACAKINALFVQHLMAVVVSPLLIGTNDEEECAHEVEQESLEPSLRLHMLARVLKIVSYRPVRDAVIHELALSCTGGLTVLDVVLGECVVDGSASVLPAMAQLLLAAQEAAQGQLWSRPTAPVDDASASAWRTGSVSPRTRTRNASVDAVGDQSAGHSHHGTDEEGRGVGACVARWATALACCRGVCAAPPLSTAASVVLARLLASEHSHPCVSGAQVAALTRAVSCLAVTVHSALLTAQEEDPVQGIGYLAGLETAAADSVHNNHVLAACAAASVDAQELPVLPPLARSPSPSESGGGGSAGETAHQARDLTLALANAHKSFDWYKQCSPWSLDNTTWALGAVGTAAAGGSGDSLVWYEGGGEDGGREDGGRTTLLDFMNTCSQLCRLRSVLAVALCPGAAPLLSLARGVLPHPPSHDAFLPFDTLADDLACGAYMLDQPLRSLAPPVDSIRPGNVFTLSTFPFYTAALYPVATGVSAPVGGAQGSIRDPLGPLTAAMASQKRVAVVLGQSYLVVAVMLAQKQQPAGAATPAGGKAAPAAAGSAAPVKVRGRAILVAPLHCTFVTPLPDAPTIVDLRLITPDDVPLGTAQDLGPWQPSAGGGGCVSRLRVRAASLTFDALEAPGKVVHHVETARARVLLSKMEEVDSLSRVDFRHRGGGEEEEEGGQRAGEG